jgi:hypothetical protein
MFGPFQQLSSRILIVYLNISTNSHYYEMFLELAIFSRFKVAFVSSAVRISAGLPVDSHRMLHSSLLSGRVPGQHLQTGHDCLLSDACVTIFPSH